MMDLVMIIMGVMLSLMGKDRNSSKKFILESGIQKSTKVSVES